MLRACLCDWFRVCPQESILFFIGCRRGKGKKEERFSLSQEIGGNQRWRANIFKSCTYFTSFESSLCLHNEWMSSRNVNFLLMTQKTKKEKEKKKISQSPLKSKIGSAVTAIIACIKQHICISYNDSTLHPPPKGATCHAACLLRANDFSMFVSAVSPAHVPRVNPPLMRLIFPESGCVSTGPMH